MNPVPRKIDQDSSDLIEEYLRNGGQVTKIDAFKRSEELEYKHMYGRGRTKKVKDE